MKNKFSIFGDGDNLIIFSKDGKAEWSYTFKDAMVIEIRIDQDNDMGELMPTLGGTNVWMPKPQPNTKFTIKGACLAENTKIESSDNGGLIPQLNLFKNVTISELFVAINKKLNKRKNDKK